MDFFKTYLRIKSNILRIININPMYNILQIIIEIINETQKVKQVIHEKSFRKNLTLKDLTKEYLTKRYSI
jgi:hypothetical protein